MPGLVSYLQGGSPKSFTLPPLGSGEAIGEKAFDYFLRGGVAGYVAGIFRALVMPPMKLQSPRIYHATKISLRMSLWNAVIFSAGSLTVNLLARYRGRDSNAHWGTAGAGMAVMYCAMAGSGKLLVVGPVMAFSFGCAVRGVNTTFCMNKMDQPVTIDTDMSIRPPPNGLNIRDRMYYDRMRWKGRLPEKEVHE
ncbi:uncharacterized protein LOC135806206 [Sycon ciliatum]|uniref:uncharacterized protein LOC135806206 n=1 Tax=Sycon ciliatum TaxID=27933 RepID=UPI0020AC825A|eukprot:scpid79807/ scgid32274/ 